MPLFKIAVFILAATRQNLRTYSGTLSYLPASTLSRTETHSDYHLDAGLEKPRTNLLVPISDPVPEDWTKIEGDFISVYLSCISRLGVSSVGVPWAKLDDGLIYLYWITADAPKSAVASYLMDMASGEHLKSRYVAMVAVRAFRLEPKEKNGIMTVDGEKVQYGPMQGQVLPSLATVLSRSGS